MDMCHSLFVGAANYAKLLGQLHLWYFGCKSEDVLFELFLSNIYLEVQLLTNIQSQRIT